MNTDQLICEIDKGVSFEMEFLVSKGRGYVPAEEHVSEEDAIGTISIDSIFTPIKNVSYDIENYRVGQKTDFEKLNINITTDSNIKPDNKNLLSIVNYEDTIKKITYITKEKHMKCPICNSQFLQIRTLNISFIVNMKVNTCIYK